MEPAERLEQIAIAQTQAGWARLAHRMAMLLLLLCPAWWSAHALDDFLTFANGLKATNQNIEATDDNSSPWQLSGVLPGRHMLHIYHAWIGTNTFAASGKTSAYDPQFHAGYLKTPLFDSAARPLETLLSVVNLGGFTSLAHSAEGQGVLVGLVVLLTPFLISQSARWAGMARAASITAGILALGVMSLTAWRESLRLGAIDRLAGAPLVLAHLGLLLHYHRHPSPLALFGLTLTTTMCWLFDPLLTLVSLPVQLWIYLRTGMKHGGGWHTGLLLACSIGLLLNISYLISWHKYWWIRVSPRWENAFFPKGIVQSLLNDPNWGEPWETMLGFWLLALGLMGGLTARTSGRRLQSAVFSLALGGVLALYALGQAFLELGRWETGSLLPAILLASCVPAGGFLAGLPLRGRKKRPEFFVDEAVACPRAPRSWWTRVSALLALIVLGGMAAWQPALAPGLLARLLAIPSMRTPISTGECSCIAFFASIKPSKGRVLWEMVPSDDERNWALILPEWTGHSMVGGLDRVPRIEHMQSGLFDGILAGRPLREWTPESFLAYCRTYQIAWVAVRSEAAVAWIAGINGLSMVFEGNTQKNVPKVYALPGNGENVALVGTARLVSADSGQLIFADVVPSRGQVVLSFHYQTGLVASPARVEVERELDYRDPIPLIRLRMDEPATRLQLRWLPP